MLHIRCGHSGHTVALLDAAEVHQLDSSHDFVASLKAYLQPILGAPRFRQRLYGEGGEVVGGWADMGAPAELQNGDFDVVRFLVEAGADIGKANDYGLTAMRSADLAGQTAIMQYLLRVKRERDFFAAEAVECATT
eukprot:Skav215426  [mRNA]  locus=scaffold745:9004:10778:- [translate_table: standard]